MVHRLAVVPPHEALAAECADSPSVMERLHWSIAASEWAASYSAHPVVRASPPGTVLPLALYIDGVPYSRHDGLLAFRVYNLITWKRHLAVVLRKPQVCACGCRKR